jgi:hypothetical protein
MAHLKTHCFLELLLDAKKLLECRILNHFFVGESYMFQKIYGLGKVKLKIK